MEDAVKDFWAGLPAWLRVLLAPVLLFAFVSAVCILFIPVLIVGSLWSVCAELVEWGRE